MKQSEWRRAYEPDPVRLEARVRHTLKNLDAAPAARPRMLRTALTWRGGLAARNARKSCFRAISRPRARAGSWAM